MWLLSLRLSLGLREAVDDCPVEHVHATGWTSLLALEPGLQASRVEDVCAGKLLAARDHLLPTDDAHIVHSLQLLNGSIRIAAGGGVDMVAQGSRDHMSGSYRVFRCRMAC